MRSLCVEKHASLSVPVKRVIYFSVEKEQARVSLDPIIPALLHPPVAEGVLRVIQFAVSVDGYKRLA